MWIQRHWRAALGVASVLLPSAGDVWRGIKWLLSSRSNGAHSTSSIDFVVSHSANPGWVGDVLDSFLNFPTVLTIPLIIMGLSLIWLDTRKWRINKVSDASARVRPTYTIDLSRLYLIRQELGSKERDASEACGPNGSLGQDLISKEERNSYRRSIRKAQSFFKKYGCFTASLHAISVFLDHLNQEPPISRHDAYEQFKALRNDIDGDIEKSRPRTSY